MISVAVCTLNPRLDYFERCIAAIRAQRFPANEYELFVVDNGSNPPVAELEIVRRLDIRVIREERPGLTAARECAARSAQHELLIFVDDDNVLNKDYLSQAARLFEDSRIGYLSGEILPEYEVPPPRWLGRFEAILAIRRFPSDRVYLTSVPEYNKYFPVGAGCCIRRSILRDYFDSLSSFGRIEGRLGNSLASGEDQDIGMYALSRGFYVGSTSRLKVSHLIPKSRLSLAYLKRLSLTSIDGAHLVNQKWRKVFGGDVMPVLTVDADLLLAKAVICWLLAFFSARYALPAVVYRRILQLRRSAARRASDF